MSDVDQEVRDLIEEERRHLAGEETALTKAVTDLNERLAEAERTIEERDELLTKAFQRIEALEVQNAVSKQAPEYLDGDEPVSKRRVDVFDHIASRLRQGYRNGEHETRVQVNPTA